MKNIYSNIKFNINKDLSLFLPFIYLGLFAYFLSFCLFLYLPKSGVDFFQKNKNSFEVKNYDYFKKIDSIKKIVENKKSSSLSSYNLTAIYSTKTGGIISLVKNNQSFIISKNEKIDGYILKKIYANYVLFEKDSKIFKLEMNIKKEKVKMANIIPTNNFIIRKSTLNNFVKNPDNFLKGISISKNLLNNKMDGFKINNIKKNTLFSKLGLKNGDIIKKINNKNISSYEEAIKIYQNINKYKYLKIELLREKKKMELNYEIN